MSLYQLCRERKWNSSPRQTSLVAYLTPFTLLAELAAHDNAWKRKEQLSQPPLKWACGKVTQSWPAGLWRDLVWRSWNGRHQERYFPFSVNRRNEWCLRGIWSWGGHQATVKEGQKTLREANWAPASLSWTKSETVCPWLLLWEKWGVLGCFGLGILLLAV